MPVTVATVSGLLALVANDDGECWPDRRTPLSVTVLAGAVGAGTGVCVHVCGLLPACWKSKVFPAVLAQGRLVGHRVPCLQVLDVVILLAAWSPPAHGPVGDVHCVRPAIGVVGDHSVGSPWQVVCFKEGDGGGVRLLFGAFC